MNEKTNPSQLKQQKSKTTICTGQQATSHSNENNVFFKIAAVGSHSETKRMFLTLIG